MINCHQIVQGIHLDHKYYHVMILKGGLQEVYNESLGVSNQSGKQ